ncbi:MAG: metallophosphoesterase [Planctomycetes bacterium]|nr:metallophosphoesterase [Planctomycetota bacterium]
MTHMASHGLIVLMLLAGLAPGPVAADESGARPAEAAEGVAAAWSPAPASTLTQEEFPLPRHDPRPLMQALIERKQPTATTPFTFVAASDWHGRGTDLFGLFQRLNPDFALTMGDLADIGFGSRGLAEYRKLEQAAGDFFRTCPTWSAPGNHEVGKAKWTAEERAEARRRFSAYFGQPHDDVFSFTYANAKFIGLPFEFYEGDGLLKRLEEELASAEGRHIFVFSHHAYYTGLWRPKNPVLDAATELFKKYKVVAVLGGGTHVYYRQRKDGVTYILNGTGGMLGQLPGNRDHPTLRNALPDDAWFGRNPDGSGGSHFIHPKLEKPIQVKGRKTFAVAITVEGPSVTMRLVDIEGKQWDTATLAGPAKQEAVPGETETNAPAPAEAPAATAAP